MMKKIYRHFGLLFTEILQLAGVSGRSVKSRVTIHNREILDSVLSEGKGALILAGHIGSWEYCLAGAAQYGLDIRVIVKEIKGKAGHDLAERMRTRHGVTMIPRKNAMKQIFRTLKDNACLGFVLDQNMTSDEGIFVDFFGKPACTMSGLATLSKKFNIPVIPTSFHRDEANRQHITLHAPLHFYTPEDKSIDPITFNTRRYNRALETIIRKHPEQWIWMHRRWRTQPQPDDICNPVHPPEESEIRRLQQNKNSQT